MSALPSRDAGRRFGLARGAPAWVAGCGVVGVTAGVAAPRLRGRARTAALATAGAGLAVCAFFRDPAREPGEGVLLAAADGVVCAVEREPDGRFRIATFMRLHDVHVNRAPVDGVVRDLQHLPGRHRPAFTKDSDVNERMAWTIDSALGEVSMVQIAGIAARRIVPYRAPGERIAQGERIGMIRFGSRVDVTLPPGVLPAVIVGQRMRAGRTRLDVA